MDIEVKPRPFSKDELKKIKEGVCSGKIRRFGAIMDHRRLNYSSNALIAWDRRSLGRALEHKMKEKNYISHIYLRKAHRLWPFGLYTMIHARTREELDWHIQELSRLLGGCKFRVLNTIKEFKKTSFNPEEFLPNL